MELEALPPNSLFSLFADRDKDPAYILSELDKGLRSSTIGEQCESIMFFNKLLARYPFPSIVTAAFLKLADLYHGTSNNVVRYCIGRVFDEQSHMNPQLLQIEKGEDQVTKDMFLQRLLQPLHSSDPCAKALTLRILGSMSVFLADDLSMQHSIRNCLSSNHPLEASAAIFAVDRVCQRSPTFSTSILPFIAELIQGLRCTPRTKLKLIYVLRHMGHNPLMIQETRTLLQKVIAELPSHIFLLVSLHTLSLLSISSLLYIPHQIKLLLHYLDDPRRKIRLLVIRDLRRIVEEASHHIQVSFFPTEKLLSLYQNTPSSSIRKELLHLIHILLRFFGNSLFDTFVEGRLIFVEACEISLCDERISMLAAEVLALLSSQEELLHTVSSLCFLVEKELQKTDNEKKLKPLLFVLSSLCRGTAKAEANVFSLLLTLLDHASISNRRILTKGIHLIMKRSHQCGQLLLPHIRKIIEEILPHPAHSKHPNITASLSESLFYGLETVPNTLEALERLRTLDGQFLQANRHWERYIIARSAVCHGFHSYAAPVFESLCHNISNLSLHYWMKSLAAISFAESSIGKQLPLSICRSSMLEALTSLRGARLKNLEFTFQEQFLSLRQRWIGHVITLLSNLPILVRNSHGSAGMETFLELSQQFYSLRSTFFDLTAPSIRLLEMNQVSCSLVVYACKVFLGDASCVPDPILLGLSIEKQNHHGAHLYEKIFKELQEEAKIVKKRSSMETAQSLSSTIRKILALRCCIPPYFFQSIPTSCVELSTLPAMASGSGIQPTLVALGVGVVLKISGRISHAPWKHHVRKLKKVEFTIFIRERFSDFQLLQLMPESSMGAIATCELSTEPRNESFVCSTILHFPAEGKYSIVIKCKIIDQKNAEWCERKNTILQIFVKDPSS